MPLSLDRIIRRQHGLQQRRISRTFATSVALTLLLSIGFSGWSILRDYQSSQDQHRHSMTSLSRALEGYTSTLLLQSYESIRVAGQVLAQQGVRRTDAEPIYAVLRDAMRYDPVSSYLYARVEGALFIIDVNGQPVHGLPLHEALQQLHSTPLNGALHNPLRINGQSGFLLPLTIAVQANGAAPLQLGALLATDRFANLIEHLGLQPGMNGGLLSAQGVVLYRTPYPEQYIGRSLPADSPLLKPNPQQISSFVETTSIAGEPSLYVITPSPRFPLAAIIGETRASFYGPWLRRSGLTLTLLAASLLLLALAATLLQRLIRQLSQDEDFYRRLFTDVSDGLLLIDRDGKILTANPVAARMFGLSEVDGLRGQLPSSLSPARQPDGRPSPLTAGLIFGSVLEGQEQQLEWQFQRLDNGEPFDCEVRVSLFRWRDRDLLLGVLHDITERKRYLVEQEFLASHDSLTRLPNRYWLNRHIEQRVNANDAQPFAVLLLDMNRFKEVNDTLGHQHGDQVLTELGQRLQHWLHEQNAEIARLGGDEMAVVSNHLADPIALTGLCSGIAQIIARPLQVDGIHLELSASIGVALFPEHARSSHDLLRCADIAMYQAKRERREFVVYHSDSDNHTPERLALHTQLSRAIRENCLALHYQPKVRLSDRQVVGFEALLRWPHPEKGMISPGDFIPLAESTELIHPLTHWVLDEALGQLRRWQEQGLGTCLAVNISPHNLLNPGFTEELRELLASHQVAAEWLELEVTEGALMADPERALRSLLAIRELGVTLSIDDFGTGYSSLAYLKRLPTQLLKIDRTFVSAMTHNASDAMIVQSTLALAHNFSMQVVAEGVEDEATAAALNRLGCDIAQGYYFGRPMPAAGVEQWRAAYGQPHDKSASN
ncbi:bifunctional diguanylate cyclase/phosphodiesterase [Aquipseudomonas guryensis]|uniref:cyclic-guanylate-specific phosphodiesterase n=1 Tax=Aquipseudomonas guryensis TaxID=2759165 RepID=A0A7W4D7W9_9GAMM|nr:EAL domain-containing protein [Pseudomonas guryensis]MBB1517650.1 EAL domain-containing protein [Pseudomonas guryensis]